MPDQPHALFTFSLDSFKITDTRSRHEDTDHVSFTLLVRSSSGAGTPQTLTKHMGDVNNGVFPVKLTFSKIAVGPTDTVILNYLIVNSGHKSPSEVATLLEGAGTKLATAGGAAIGSAVPVLGTALGAVAGWLAGQLVGILNANCDGPVAAEQNSFVYRDLLAETAKGPFTHTTKHPGTNSPHGCGSNSVYYVTWHIQHEK